MSAATDAIIAGLFAKYVHTLTKNAAAGFLAGALAATRKLRQKPEPATLSRMALAYAREYRKDLVENGGTVVNVLDEKGRPIGKEFKPWLKDRERETREKVAAIITDGLAKGKPVGARELPGGRYRDGSIAADLQEYFHARKGHAALVARTESARILVEGSKRRYKDAGIRKVRWLAGPNCCDACRELAAGGPYDLDNLPADVPLHPACACDLSPVVEDLQ